MATPFTFPPISTCINPSVSHLSKQCANQADRAAPPTYTSAPYSQPASASSTSHSNPQSGPTPLPRPASQPAHNMAAPPGPFIPNAMMQQRQPGPNGALSQQSQLQNAVQGQQGQTHPPQPANQLPPHLAARERARVSVLLEINTHLLQEVVSLQAQGKAGMPPQPQQSPVKESAGSPTSVTDPANQLNNSPVDPPKPAGGKPPSPEYVDCMRRLQANLAYLAAIADAKKKASGTLPVGPAITAPPAHLAEVAELYKKLNMLFPSASQTAVSRAMAIAGAQTPKPQNSVQAHG